MFGNDMKFSLKTFSGKSEDYPNFRFSLRAYVGAHGMLKYLDKLEPCPDDIDYRIYLLISNSIEGEAITTARNTPEGKGVEMYTRLEDRYKSTRSTRKFMLLRQLLQSKCKDPADVLNFLDQKVSAGAELEQMDIKLEEIVVLSILDNLPEEFKGISELAMAQEKVGVEVVKRLVVEKYDQFCLREQTTSVDVLGLAAEARVCFYCNKKGHIASDCRKKKLEQSSGKPAGGKFGSPPGLAKKQCSHCKKTNHTDNECWSKKKRGTGATARVAEALSTVA